MREIVLEAEVRSVWRNRSDEDSGEWYRGARITSFEPVLCGGRPLFYVHQNVRLGYLYDPETDRYLKVVELVRNAQLSARDYVLSMTEKKLLNELLTSLVE